VEENNSALFLRCPLCGGVTNIKVYPETVLLNFSLYCPECKRETNVNVAQQKMAVCGQSNA